MYLNISPIPYITPKNIILNIMWTTPKSLVLLLHLCLYLVPPCESYLDISVQIQRSPGQISYQLPIKINNVDYKLTTSLSDGENYIVPVDIKIRKSGNKAKKISNKAKQAKQGLAVGVVEASSLEGYSFQGWRRFFMEAFLYIESRYYHQIQIDLTNLQKNIKPTSDNNNSINTDNSDDDDDEDDEDAEDEDEDKKKGKSQKSKKKVQKDGMLTFGPDLLNNKIFQLIRENNQFVKKGIVSIYRGINDKNVRMQLGGFEESFARGHRNGVLFYQVDLISNRGKWWVPMQSISCMRERNGKDQIFYLSNSAINLSISLQSPVLRLPLHYSSQLQRNFQTQHTSCKITRASRLSCQNMTSIDMSLSFIQFHIDNSAYINISLYDLQDHYNQSTFQTVFNIEFVDGVDLQLGEAFFKGYYVAIDLQQRNLFFSPINRFPGDNYGVFLVRFFVGFCVFMVVSALGAMIWQVCSDIEHKKKIRFGQEGIQLVSYQRPGIQSQELQ